MAHTRHERPFEESGTAFHAVFTGQDDRMLSVSVRLPDGSLRPLPGRHFGSEDDAFEAARAFARELVGDCR